MAINFPDTPVNGSTYDYEGIRYIFRDTGEAGYWQVGSLGAVGAATTEQVDEGTDALKFVTPESLEGSKYTVENGTYPDLRAQGTTKADVGLSNVANYGISDSRTSNTSTQVFLIVFLQRQLVRLQLLVLQRQLMIGAT